MTELMRRRRALIGAQETASWQPIVTTWSRGQIGDSGEISVNFAFRSDYIAVQPGYQIRRDGPATGRDNKIVAMYVHEYTGTTWKKRTYLNPNGGSIRTISDGTDYVRLTFAYGSTSGMTMTLTDVDTYAKPMMKR